MSDVSLLSHSKEPERQNVLVVAVKHFRCAVEKSPGNNTRDQRAAARRLAARFRESTGTKTWKTGILTEVVEWAKANRTHSEVLKLLPSIPANDTVEAK